MLGRVTKTEGIWLWARVWQLCSPVRVTTAQRTLDAIGNTITITDAKNNTTRTKYDLANRVIEVTAANGDFTETTYDEVGNALTKTDGAARTSVMVYDKRSRKRSETNAAGELTEYTYDGVGNLKTTKKPIGTWTYAFDAADRLKTVTTPDTHVTAYSYDKNNNRTVAKNANLNPLTMAYNSRNTLKSLTYPNSEAEEYRYDENDNRIGQGKESGHAGKESGHARKELGHAKFSNDSIQPKTQSN